jgi:hypothetical protein
MKAWRIFLTTQGAILVLPPTVRSKHKHSIKSPMETNGNAAVFWIVRKARIMIDLWEAGERSSYSRSTKWLPNAMESRKHHSRNEIIPTDKIKRLLTASAPRSLLLLWRLEQSSSAEVVNVNSTMLNDLGRKVE